MNKKREAARRVPNHLRDLAQRFFDAGWTEADVLYALDNGPDGPVKVWGNPMLWDVAKARLREWMDEQMQPLASPSQRRARVASLTRFDQMRRRREWAEAMAQRSKDLEGAARSVREVLAASSPSAARVMALRVKEPGPSRDPQRWARADEAARSVMEAGVVAEPWEPEEPGEVEDPVEVARREAHARALARARWERRQK